MRAPEGQAGFAHQRIRQFSHGGEALASAATEMIDIHAQRIHHCAVEPQDFDRRIQRPK